MQRNSRMKRELKLLAEDPPHGVSCWAVGDELHHLEAKIIGANGTPYHGGVFKIDIQIPERYPFEPPKMRFVTPIYHPNIDNSGRICLDIIKMPPKGMWKPALNIGSILSSILLLMDKPNPDDPLMADIANEFRYNYSAFFDKAKQWTLTHATDGAPANQTQNEELAEKHDENDVNISGKEKALDSDTNSSSESESDEENNIPQTTNMLKGVKRICYDDKPSTSGLRPSKIRKV
ncbi:ubiquitin-conjugating enzyme E2 T-like [Actinia tenebrosa]|uniref:Ubiquitin-conjugating enzyme E2 T n=1 Tax=Actinia tenebrosa TaxID=6105 RepID=A0A6P8H9S1_ACTTE|nr:ubiquitin-conjugating enzyme E2 T-like [Actinia tenebrosa]